MSSPPPQEKLQKVSPSISSTWTSRQPGLTLHKQYAWLTELLPQPGPTTTAPPPASAPLSRQLEFMLQGWKQSRCLLPYRHPPDKCSGYHVLPGGTNSAVLVFDARRPAVKEGKVMYAPEWCR